LAFSNKKRFHSAYCRHVSKRAATSVLVFSAMVQPLYAIERHPAPVASQEATNSLPTGETLTGSDDATPLGVNVGGIAVDDAISELPSGDISGVEIATANPVINDPKLRNTLNGFIGQPLSFKLIDDVRAVIVKHMRDRNRPLVAVIVPPQEITGGTLRVAVLPFVVGEKKVDRLQSEHRRSSDEEVLGSVRVQPGEEINSRQLIEDLNWLNRSPFRKVGAVFDKGRLPGETDITLTLRDDRPWQVFGGYMNSGTQATGYDRLYGGLAAELPWDALISYQYVTSPETVYSDGRFHNLAGDKAYLSHSFSYAQAFENRMRLTVDGSYIHSRARQTNVLVQDSRLIETGAQISFPASALGPASEVFAGVEVKQQQAEREFSGIPLGASNIEIYQLNAGLSSNAQWKTHRFGYGLKAVFSPGGIGANNTDAAFQAFSANTRMKSRYGYLQAWGNAAIDLPGDWRFDVTGRGQLASGVLPETERFDIGGTGSVRGYSTGEASGDHGLAIQTELHLPLMDLGQVSIDLFGFTDHGRVFDRNTSRWTEMTSIGLGAGLKLADRLSLQASWGHTLEAGPVSRKHDNRLHDELNTYY